jgi:hypothetical protein
MRYPSPEVCYYTRSSAQLGRREDAKIPSILYKRIHRLDSSHPPPPPHFLPRILVSSTHRARAYVAGTNCVLLPPSAYGRASTRQRGSSLEANDTPEASGRCLSVDGTRPTTRIQPVGGLKKYLGKEATHDELKEQESEPRGETMIRGQRRRYDTIRLTFVRIHWTSFLFSFVRSFILSFHFTSPFLSHYISSP